MKFVIVSIAIVFNSSTGAAGTCEERFADVVRKEAVKKCGEAPKELLATGGPLIRSSGKHWDRYGFFIRCKSGESYAGSAQVKTKDSSCIAKIEVTKRLESVALETKENDDKP